MSSADNRTSRSRDHSSTRDKDYQSSSRDREKSSSRQRDRSPVERSDRISTTDRDRRSHNGKLDQVQVEATTDEFDPNNKKKIASRCRLFVGNLSNEVKESDLRDLFSKYGEITECFMSSKGFGFVRLATRARAEMAKENLDGYNMKGRNLRVRYAVHGASLKISELSPYVSNELLHQAFSIFGEVERAVHILDEKSQPTGDGVVEFERKPAAVDALRRINEGVFLLSSNPRPVFVEPLEPKDDEDGLMERMVPKNAIFQKERLFPPRFALPGSFEFEFGNRWKELYRVERLRREQLESELKEAREKLENEMELAFQEYQAAQLREDLRRRQEELERLEAVRRERMEAFRLREEERERLLRSRQMLQQQQQQPPPVGQQFGGAYGKPQFTPPYPMTADGRFGDKIRPEGLQGQRKAPGDLPRPPVPPGSRPEDSLSHGVQKLMQMMQQGQARANIMAASTSMPPPMDAQQRMQQLSSIRPNLMTGAQFQDERDHRRVAPWPTDPDRARTFYR